MIIIEHNGGATLCWPGEGGREGGREGGHNIIVDSGCPAVSGEQRATFIRQSWTPPACGERRGNQSEDGWGESQPMRGLERETGVRTELRCSVNHCASVREVDIQVTCKL